MHLAASHSPSWPAGLLCHVMLNRKHDRQEAWVDSQDSSRAWRANIWGWNVRDYVTNNDSKFSLLLFFIQKVKELLFERCSCQVAQHSRNGSLFHVPGFHSYSCPRPNMHRDDWIARAWQDFHIDEVIKVSKLDRGQHKRYVVVLLSPHLH